jgi:hypothetical protein
MTNRKTHILLLNSADRSISSTSPYDVRFALNENDVHNVKSVQFKGIAFSQTMHNVNNYNNTMAYEVLGVPKILTIPNGNYSITSFVTSFNAIQGDIVITDDIANRRFTFTSGSNTQIKLVGTTMDRVLGLTADTIVGTAYTANHIYSLIYTYFVHVVSSELARGDNCITSNRKKMPIIASIPITSGFGFLTSIDETLDTSDYSVQSSGLTNLSSLGIKLVDDNFRVIDLNGSNFVISFRIETH